jgi:predicted TIM-barrel fold metal-dependent hydrolase
VKERSLLDKHLPVQWDCHLHVFDAALPTLGGHYAPQTASLAQVQALAAPHGINRFVLVQPSVYGRDNSLMLRALQAVPGLHRGVAVVDESVSDAELNRMHQIGVRGIRFNRVSPVGRHPDPAATLRELAPNLRRLGWHVQWFVEADDLAALAAIQQESGLPFVIDHLGKLDAQLSADAPAWRAMERLGKSGQCWLKLSAWYRLRAREPYEALDPVLTRLLPWFSSGEQLRLVWGSDWPHTGIAKPDLPDYGLLLAPLSRVFSAHHCEQVLRISPQILYG